MNTKPTNETHALITPEHLRRRAVVYCRQAGADRNTSSMVYQRSLADVARSYGWTDTLIEIIDEDWGKFALSRVERRGLQRLEEMIEADQVGAVFVTNVSRLWRQVMEFELFRLRAALHNTLLYTDGRFIDPADANDLIVSQIVSLRDRWLATQKSKGPVRK
jgi:Resolvase, N terminal domain